MKLSFNMDGLKVPESLQSQTTATARPARYKKMAVVAVCLVTVAGLVCLMFYLGATSTTKAHEAAWRVFKDDEGKVVEEKITKTDDAVDIDVPNSMEVVYDYKHGLTFTRYTDTLTKKRGPCYATYTEESTGPQPDSEFTDTTQMMTPTDDATVQEHWRFTTNKVPASMASLPEVQEMCHDTDIYWMQKEDAAKVKREDYTLTFLFYVEYTGYYAGVYGTFYDFWFLVTNAEGVELGYYYETYFVPA